MSIALFLPVRSGSERIKNKNTRPFANFKNGIFELKLNQFIDIKGVDEIIISSNDQRCLEIAEIYKHKIKNIIIDERPDYLGSTSTKLEDLILYAGNLTSCENILWTHATNPLFNTLNYNHAIDIYLKKNHYGYDSLVTGYTVKDFLIDPKTLQIINNKSDLKWPRTQDLTDLFTINNAVFLANRSYYKKGDRLGINPYLMNCDKVSSLDIDYEDDFLITEAVYEKLER